MNKITVLEIPEDFYEGYLWLNDESSPTVFLGDYTIDVNIPKDKFIVEGLLWSPNSKMSYRIIYHDGLQEVFQYQVTDEDLEGSNDAEYENYLSHRIPGVARLSFLRYWKPEPDEFCEGFEVLMPSQLVFVGFNNIK